MEDHQGLVGVITSDVRYHPKLLDGAKPLYCEITALSDRRGYCFASNKYFAKLYNKSEVTISRRISSLREHGFVKAVTVKGQRRLYPHISAAFNEIEDDNPDFTLLIKNDKEGISKMIRGLIKNDKEGLTKMIRGLINNDKHKGLIKNDKHNSYSYINSLADEIGISFEDLMGVDSQKVVEGSVPITPEALTVEKIHKCVKEAYRYRVAWRLQDYQKIIDVMTANKMNIDFVMFVCQKLNEKPKVLNPSKLLLSALSENYERDWNEYSAIQDERLLVIKNQEEVKQKRKQEEKELSNYDGSGFFKMLRNKWGMRNNLKENRDEE